MTRLVRSSTCPGADCGHHRHQRHVFRIAHLLERQRLEIAIRFDRFDEIGDLDGPHAWTQQRLGLRGRGRPFVRSGLAHFVDLIAKRANQRLLLETNRVRELRALGDLPSPEQEAMRGVGLVDPRPAKGPAGAGRHVNAEPEPARFAERVIEQRQPGIRQVGDELRFVSSNAVDRRDLDAAESGVAKRFELARDRRGIKRAAQPPPARPRPGLARDDGPVRGCASEPGPRQLPWVPKVPRVPKERRGRGRLTVTSELAPSLL